MMIIISCVLALYCCWRGKKRKNVKRRLWHRRDELENHKCRLGSHVCSSSSLVKCSKRKWLFASTLICFSHVLFNRWTRIYALCLRMHTTGPAALNSVTQVINDVNIFSPLWTLYFLHASPSLAPFSSLRSSWLMSINWFDFLPLLVVAALVFRFGIPGQIRDQAVPVYDMQLQRSHPVRSESSL